MDLAELRIFSAVVEAGGITPAARRLHRVQSNVTTRVRQLEDELGVDLFVREGKRLHLSPAGRVLLDYADRLLALADEAEAAVRGARPMGVFRLGAMESTAAVRLPRPLAEYSRRYPDVTLELRTGNPAQLSAALLANEIDAALVAEPVADARFHQRVVFEEEPVVVTAATYPAIVPRVAATMPATVIVFEHGCPHRQRLEAWYADNHAAPGRTVELRSYHAMLGCVLAGMGAALLPRSVLTTFPEAKRLRTYTLPRRKHRLRTMLIWRRAVPAPNVEALAEILAPAGANTKRR